MKKIITYLSTFLECDGKTSSKRLVGILASLSLIVYMFIWPTETSNNSVLILALGSLGISSFEKLGVKKETKDEVK